MVIAKDFGRLAALARPCFARLFGDTQQPGNRCGTGDSGPIECETASQGAQWPWPFLKTGAPDPYEPEKAEGFAMPMPLIVGAG
jgi:hypothetical protein